MQENKLGFTIELVDSYDAALELIAATLKTEGFGILTRIDVRQTLKEKLGAEFRPYTILGACNPSLAHRALLEDPEIGLLLPCSITVEASPSGGSIIRIADPAMMMLAGKVDNPTLQSVAAEAREKLVRVAGKLS